jgi:hypothetical protein
MLPFESAIEMSCKNFTTRSSDILQRHSEMKLDIIFCLKLAESSPRAYNASFQMLEEM